MHLGGTGVGLGSGRQLKPLPGLCQSRVDSGRMDGQMDPQTGIIPFPDRTAEAGTGRLLGAVGHQFQTEAMQCVQASWKGGSCQDADWPGVKEPARGLQGGGTWPQKPEQECSHCAVCQGGVGAPSCRVGGSHVGGWSGGDRRAGPGQGGPPHSGTSAGAQSLPLLGEDPQARGCQLAWTLSSPAPSLCLQMGTQPV